ncbi:hypothetical protein [uncultured Methylobacterium sp.]|uniref:hypothetical protein n=1 Tax=uncultured Methylobacterium sp. TaxID=157278 RepID=UPI0035CAEECB
MSRSIQRSTIIALGLAGGLIAAVPAFADAESTRGLSCAPAEWMPDQAECRAVAHRRRFRPDFARVRAPAHLIDTDIPFAGRYVSLLILGVGY